MKYIIFLFLLIPAFCSAQKIDTVINAGIYKSYYNYELKQPIYVSYKLYKGGGPCSRKGMSFKTGGLKSSATSDDYYKSGYDQGHIANFEDFALDCESAESTFRFYNVIPQTQNLNRGVWKMYEFIIRKVSQNDSLLVIGGGNQYNKTIGNGVYVPEHCWKVVYSLSKKVIIYCLWFENSELEASVTDETIGSLEERLGYNIRQYLK